MTRRLPIPLGLLSLFATYSRRKLSVFGTLRKKILDEPNSHDSSSSFLRTESKTILRVEIVNILQQIIESGFVSKVHYLIFQSKRK